MSVTDTLLAPMPGAEHREVGGVQLDTVAVGICRVKRVLYPKGFRWSKNMKPLVSTDLCMHAHVGFLARGEIHMEFADGCVLKNDYLNVHETNLYSCETTLGLVYSSE